MAGNEYSAAGTDPKLCTVSTGIFAGTVQRQVPVLGGNADQGKYPYGDLGRLIYNSFDRNHFFGYLQKNGYGLFYFKLKNAVFMVFSGHEAAMKNKRKLISFCSGRQPVEETGNRHKREGSSMIS